MSWRTLRLWVLSSLWGVILLLLASGYIIIQTNHIDLFLFNHAIAFAGLFLINMSHALSGMSYFWKIGASKLAWRKELGVVGFVMALLHGTISAFFLKPIYVFPDFIFDNPLPFIASSSAVLIFTMMFIVSNFGIPRKIGGILWRQLLRVGYAGILLVMIHMFILAGPAWKNWLIRFQPVLPPLSLILFVFSVFVLLLRIALWYSLRKKTVQTTSTITTQSSSIPNRPPTAVSMPN
ncbi:hypothetical protein HY468_05760 [Candidatus Roizmanbacteria bacterium]|nr:hypothetical protein [Candidatus Roizmanbacteria bacterium]